MACALFCSGPQPSTVHCSQASRHLYPSPPPHCCLPPQVGPQKNQAFVEMAFVQQAMAIVQHYQSSGEPAKIRGRPTFINYSGRDKLTNITSSDVPTPVLQAAMNDIQVGGADGCLCVRLRACVCACGGACVRACVRCVCICVLRCKVCACVF